MMVAMRNDRMEPEERGAQVERKIICMYVQVRRVGAVVAVSES